MARVPSTFTNKENSRADDTQLHHREPMASSNHVEQNTGDLLIRQFKDAAASHPSTDAFSCSGSLQTTLAFGRNYGDFTSTKTPVNCPQALVQDCSPATFGCDGEDVLDVKIRRAGSLHPRLFSTNFNPYDFGIVDAIARELRPGIARAGNQPAVERWGVVSELYKLNFYSGPSGMFKPHVDTPRGRTHFGSLVVALPTEFKGGQLRLVHQGKERRYLDGEPDEGLYNSDRYDIRWVAFYSDCEHEVLPVTAGHRVTLTYQLYVSEHVGGLTQPHVLDSATERLYRSAKDLFASRPFLKDGGILGIHCAYQYHDRREGTDYYERYPLTLKGIDAAIFAAFRALDLTVHIRPYERGSAEENGNNRYQSLFSTEEPRGSGNATTETSKALGSFNRGGHVGEEILEYTKWLNGAPAADPAGEGCLGDTKPTRYIGNESEVDWDYSFRALFVVVPAFLHRSFDPPPLQRSWTL
ncbi:hypothetical protein PG988_004459 [Apiospora saccharicola]